MSSDQLKILEKLNDLGFTNGLQLENIKSILVFGSVLTEDFTEESDIDIAVLGEKKLSIKNILKLELVLEDIFNRNIDVVDLNSENLDIFIKINILNNSKSIYSSDNNKTLDNLIDKVEWYYRENENFFKYRKRDLLS